MVVLESLHILVLPLKTLEKWAKTTHFDPNEFIRPLQISHGDREHIFEPHMIYRKIMNTAIEFRKIYYE